MVYPDENQSGTLSIPRLDIREEEDCSVDDSQSDDGVYHQPVHSLINVHYWHSKLLTAESRCHTPERP